MAKRAYSNIYTILEKSRKGELDFDDNSSGYSSPKLFSTIDVYKKSELIQPYVHYIDAYNIKKIVKSHVVSDKVIGKVEAYAKTHGLKPREGETFHEAVFKAYDAFPASLTNDIFNLLNKKVENLTFSDRSDNNKTRYQFLEKSNLPVEKVMTEGSNLKSVVFTKNLVEAFITMMSLSYLQSDEEFNNVKNELNKDDKNDDSQDGEQSESRSGNGKGSGNSQKQIDKMLNSSFAKKQIDKAIDDARNQCENISDMLSSEEEKQMWDKLEIDSKALDDISPEALERHQRELASIRLNMNSLKQHLKKILDKSVNYFSSRDIVQYEGLFDADSVDGLEEFHLLHPKLRKVMADDVQIKNTKKVGKINIYIDISGSMDGGCGLRDDNGNYITKMTFAKALAFKMKEMGLLNRVFAFDTKVFAKGNRAIDILALDAMGGTNLDKPVESIIHLDENAIILTDAESGCYTYSSKAFFLGVSGAEFCYFKPEVLEKYYSSQMCVYDGTKLYNVNERGYAIQ
jgi:uncharacterized protein with von Willebrand factor type A (vWA) domain